ncbi:MAG: hypothetical protein L0Z50_20320, partial [Verrucomicrobiales bacterium]|nr:hypothetical protein [Verrucomicrobiales bacterium]
AFGLGLRCSSGHRALRLCSLLAPRPKPKSLQQTVFYPTVWSVTRGEPGRFAVRTISVCTMV